MRGMDGADQESDERDRLQDADALKAALGEPSLRAALSHWQRSRPGHPCTRTPTVSWRSGSILTSRDVGKDARVAVGTRQQLAPHQLVSEFGGSATPATGRRRPVGTASPGA
jgi:hypothetical protein